MPPGYSLYFHSNAEVRSWLSPREHQLLDAAPPDARILIAERLEELRSTDATEEELPCCWLDQQNHRCRFYHYRPDACRDFERDSRACHDCRHLYEPAPRKGTHG